MRSIEKRLAKLERATQPAVWVPWVTVIVHIGETLDEVIEREFGGARPENLIVRQIVAPDAVRHKVQQGD